MFESEVYFEPYHHVYNVMRNFDEDTFPMKNYIIDVDVSISLTNSNPKKKLYQEDVFVNGLATLNYVTSYCPYSNNC